MGDWNFVIAAYALTGLTLGLYAVSLFRRHRRSGDGEGES